MINDKIKKLYRFLKDNKFSEETAFLRKIAEEYTVVSGDTLSEIAQRHGVKVSEIQSANSMGNSTRIYLGQDLIIPEPENSTEIIAATLLGEVGTTNPSAMPAIMAVIKNRAEVRGLSEYEIVSEKKQFSYWNGKNPSGVLEGPLGRKHRLWEKAMDIASGNISLPDIGGSTHYYSKSINPPFWAKGSCWQKLYEDDSHVFGKDTSGRYGSCQPG